MITTNVTGCLQSNVLSDFNRGKDVSRAGIVGHGVRQEVSSDRSYRYIVVNFGACLTFLIDFHLFMQQTPSHFNFLNIISQFSIVFFVVLMDVALLPLLVKLFIQLLHLPKRKRRKKRNRQWRNKNAQLEKSITMTRRRKHQQRKTLFGHNLNRKCVDGEGRIIKRCCFVFSNIRK